MNNKTLFAQRIIAVVLLLLAIAYTVMPYDFDSCGVLGYVDDFFLFMAAFSFMQSTFQRPERHFLRRQLSMIAIVFLCLAVCWLAMLAFTPLSTIAATR